MYSSDFGMLTLETLYELACLVMGSKMKPYKFTLLLCETLLYCYKHAIPRT
jgi:hypothetical protein